ncbi:MAG TPA: winged helix-turn-helix transcriptional regulator [Candidatus Thermoplasmatota archaeon]|nr:winged helix-turn-helix transcriptional regulator [Candidatus Thermoplasmatota archaeon]
MAAVILAVSASALGAGPAVNTGAGQTGGKTGDNLNGKAPDLGSDLGFGDLVLDPDFQLGLLAGVVGVAGITLAALAASSILGTKFVNSENVLDNPARRSIFDYIKENPGAHLRATATALSLSTTNVLWHLRKLEAANLVTSKKFEGYKVFYPVEGGVETRRRALAASVLKNENAREILEYICANPSAHQREVARALNVNHGTIRWHLRKLNEVGLVVLVKKEHTIQYYLSDLGAEFLRDYQGAAKAPAAGDLAPALATPAQPLAAQAGGGYVPAGSQDGDA